MPTAARTTKGRTRPLLPEPILPVRKRRPEALTTREQEILELLSQGKVSKEIAEQLAISYHTVRVHTKHIYEKLHVRSRAEAVLKFMADKGGPPASVPSRIR